MLGPLSNVLVAVRASGVVRQARLRLCIGKTASENRVCPLSIELSPSPNGLTQIDTWQQRTARKLGWLANLVASSSSTLVRLERQSPTTDKYDRKLEKKMKRISESELSNLLSQDGQEPIEPCGEEE